MEEEAKMVWGMEWRWGHMGKNWKGKYEEEKNQHTLYTFVKSLGYIEF